MIKPLIKFAHAITTRLYAKYVLKPHLEQILDFDQFEITYVYEHEVESAMREKRYSELH